MKDSSVNRWMWLIGLVAVALLFVSFGPLSSGSPGENASGVTVAHGTRSRGTLGGDSGGGAAASPAPAQAVAA
jgi:hypothetical protein